MRRGKRQTKSHSRKQVKNIGWKRNAAPLDGINLSDLPSQKRLGITKGDGRERREKHLINYIYIIQKILLHTIKFFLSFKRLVDLL